MISFHGNCNEFTLCSVFHVSSAVAILSTDRPLLTRQEHEDTTC